MSQNLASMSGPVHNSKMLTSTIHSTLGVALKHVRDWFATHTITSWLHYPSAVRDID